MKFIQPKAVTAAAPSARSASGAKPNKNVMEVVKFIEDDKALRPVKFADFVRSKGTEVSGYFGTEGDEIIRTVSQRWGNAIRYKGAYRRILKVTMPVTDEETGQTFDAVAVVKFTEDIPEGVKLPEGWEVTEPKKKAGDAA